MRIKTTDFASGRTRDGRQFAAMDGAVLDADDTDRDKVDLFRHFVAVGVAELVEPEPEPAGEEPPVPGAPEHLSELDSLRAQAEAVGVKVDKRWGADRLRDELATAAGVSE